jgi:HEAT repeat protein
MNVALGDEAWQVRLSAVHYFGDRREMKYRGVLETALRDHHILVRNAAESALRKLPDNS